VPHILALVEPFNHPLGEPKWELLEVLTITLPTRAFLGIESLALTRCSSSKVRQISKQFSSFYGAMDKDHRIVCMDLGGNALINGHSGIELEESKGVPHASHLKRAGFDFCASPLRISMP
jgi:hypothetical protein